MSTASVIVKQKVQSYIEDQFLVSFPDDIEMDTNLFDSQTIDSFGLIELIKFLESEFDISVTNDDLVSGRLVSTSQIVALVQERAAK